MTRLQDRARFPLTPFRSADFSRLRRVALLPLIAATYFMVSGGPYGLEDIVGQAGYGRALLLLCVVPVIWSLPTALMIGELASAMPAEGGFYIWVSRALGRFWGFQEAWLSLAASIFDMAIYPALAVAYLSQLDTTLTPGHRNLLAVFIVMVCVAWNLRGAYSVGQGSLWMLVLFLLPFLGIIVAGLSCVGVRPVHTLALQPPLHGSLVTALLFVLWNYMGWDNASTIAQEVEHPRRNYIRAMLGAVVLVTISYIVPVAVVACSGIASSTFTTGAWVVAAQVLGTQAFGHHAGEWLALAVVAGGAMTGIAMFNALTLSYARVPAAMADDGLLPRVFARRMGNGVPWVSVLACGMGWALALTLQLTRLLELDIMLYGAALILEFVALVVLRWKAPGMARPFSVPGGKTFVVVMSLAPTALICFTVWAARGDHLAPHIPALAVGGGIAITGLLVYPLTKF